MLEIKQFLKKSHKILKVQDWIQFYAKNPAKLQIYKLKPLDTAHLTGCAIVTLK